MVRSYELTFHDLQIIMGEFSNLVDEKVLQKMPYNMWRQMTHIIWHFLQNFFIDELREITHDDLQFMKSQFI